MSTTALCMRCRVTFQQRPVDSWLLLAQRRNYGQAATKLAWMDPTREERKWPPREFRDRGERHDTCRHDRPGSTPRRTPFDWAKGSKKPNQFHPNPRVPAFVKPEVYVPPPDLKLEDVPTYMAENVQKWANAQATWERLLSFGIPERDLRPLLKAFVQAVKSGSLTTPENFTFYELDRFAEPPEQRSSSAVIFCSTFYWWATHPSQRPLLVNQHNISKSTLNQMKDLADATNREHLSEEFPNTRRVKRKVIMHVGPTNSGKTHHALRALAAAKSGVYAGPLRLLAHEIWERLNLGTIAPLGVEDGTFVNHDKEVIAAMPHIDMVKQLGNPEWARLTNMITGEEQKVVAGPEVVGLLSCTVEMLSSVVHYDVAVVDEIQMITDAQRGSAWTQAVLGISAREVHLCGEETVVPIIENLLKNTGDELVVKRYERLTPLKVEEESLGGDYSKVRKGDAIVAFNRSAIFDIRRQVESKTGLRCAVVYGRLPPEIRSEQATLFNDPNSGYDVLVGSDAIGMGLNLKIRRTVFDAVSKFHGTGETMLSISQVKQIAGRAGRFGLHTDEQGGSTTTLHEDDLSYLRQAVASPFVPLPFARVTFDSETFAALIPLLPPGSATSTVIYAHHYIGRLPRGVRYQEGDFDVIQKFDFIDDFADSLTIKERVLHLNAPVAWRDGFLVDVVRHFLELARDRMYVDIHESIRRTRFLEVMEKFEHAMESDHVPRTNLRDLSVLETFHKALVLYIWMSFRAPVLYPQFDEASELKVRLEKVLEFALRGMSDSRYLKKAQKDELVHHAPVRPKIPYGTKKSFKAAAAAAEAASHTSQPVLQA